MPTITIPSFTIPSVTVLGKTYGGQTIGGGSFGGQTFSTPNLPTIPRLDEGGIVTAPMMAGLAMNSRPEAVIPLDKLGGLGGLKVEVHAETIYGYESLVDVVTEGLTEAERRGLR